MPIPFRGLTLRNRVGFSPMCTFRGERGFVTDFHREHYAARSLGGAGLVMVEATAVEARGVIAPDDLGLWSDAHVAGMTDMVRRIKAGGAAAGIQLAHAGRKAGSYEDVDGTKGMDVIGPSPLPFDAGRPVPRALTVDELVDVRDAFVAATKRALAAGFDLIELHCAHGYLLSSFLSPLPNHRTDEYGGATGQRMRFPLEVIDAMRGVMPAAMPLWVRVSAIDPEPGGQTIDDTIAFAVAAKSHGVALIDCSAGGQTPRGWLKAKPGYQAKFAEAVKRGATVPTAAVGVITEAEQAEAILNGGRADVVLVGRAMRENADWANDARQILSGPLSLTLPRERE